MNTQAVHTVVGLFRDRTTAEYAISGLKRMRAGGLIDIEGMAVVAKGTDGKLAVDEVGDLSGRQGATRGALVGAAIGLLFPPSLLASAIFGAGLGGIAARV